MAGAKQCRLDAVRIPPIDSHRSVSSYNRIYIYHAGLRGQERAARRAESWHILEVVVTVQCRLNAMGVPLPVKRKHKLYPGKLTSTQYHI